MAAANTGIFNAAQHVNVSGSTLISVGGNYFNNMNPSVSSDQVSSLPTLRLPSALFTGRSDHLQTLKEHFCNPSKERKYFLLHGMGGIGKTQICLQFIHQNKNWFSDIFWIDASSEGTIDLRLKQITRAKNISAASALDWLAEQDNWLMVFDSADGGYKIVEKFLPPGESGNILITSRNKDLMRITLKKNSMEILEMDEKEAISLLLKSATIEDDSKKNMALASNIVSELGYIPLAIDQAGAYIQACCIGLDDYLDLYSNQCRELMTDSLFEGASNYGKSTYGTWEISMKEIESRATSGSGPESLAAQSAVILYKYFAFMHHDGISEEIFKTAAENYKKRDIEKEKSLRLPLLVVLIDPKALFLDEAGLWNRHQFQVGIQVLISFALIKSSNKLYSIHPLVHAWSRNRMSTSSDVSVGYHITAALLSCTIEPYEYIDNYALCMQIVPHMKACHAHALKLNLEIMTFDDECNRFGFVFFRAGNWEEAMQLCKVMMEARKEKLGVDHIHTLWSMQYLANAYGNQGRLDEAEQWSMQVLKGWKAKIGADHPDTLFSMQSLAMIYYNQGRLDEAERLQLQVLAGRKAKLGADHPCRLSSMHELAKIYCAQGRFNAAEQLQLQVLEKKRAKLGADHLNTFFSMQQFGNKKLHSQVLDDRKAKLGEDHLDTLMSMHDLAMTYSELGRFDEAEKLQLQVLDARKAKLGADHPNTLRSMHNLAMTYYNKSRLDVAEQLQLQVLDATKVKLGADHPDTLSSMNGLAIIYYEQGRFDEAEKLHLQALDDRKVKLGEDHLDTLLSMHNLATIYCEQGRLDEAEKLQLQVLDARKAKLGADHPNTLWSMHNLAIIYYDEGRLDRAEQLELQVLDARKAKLGADHPDTFCSMHSLAVTYHSQGRMEEAEKLQLQVVDGRKAKLGANHPDTFTSMQHLEELYHDQARSWIYKCCLERRQSLEEIGSRSSRQKMLRIFDHLEWSDKMLAYLK
ncbi:hypothetical protein F5887DRAFT_1281075 [Amanita rubescens]|nr:hypothetical protein F5887DRAFT_1281075 [Amanita rubescens]